MSPSPDGNGNPTASDGQSLARGIAMDSRFPAPQKYTGFAYL
ncbi:hypothetical protein [Chryseobacterium sp. FH1]|nr:hypothetical protein [Chryseobacterium sp. FH1]